MMVGDRFYSEADMMRMQRDAEARVREMQERAKQTARETQEGSSFIPSFVNTNRNWNSYPSSRSRRGQNNRAQSQSRRQQGAEPRERESAAESTVHEQPGAPFGAAAPSGDSAPAAGFADEKKTTTIIDDIVGSLGVESDTLLIIGILLILINQKADTTLILALAYLLL